MIADSPSTFIKRFLDFSIGPLISATISFFIVPVTTYFVSPADFGRSAMYTMAYSMFSLFVFLGIDQAFVREFNVEDNKQDLFWNAFIYPFAFSIITGIFCIISQGPLSMLMFGSREPYIISILAISLPFAVIDRFNMLVIRMEERGKLYSVIIITTRVINVFVLLFNLIFISKTYQSIINATFYSLAITCAIEIAVNARYFKSKFTLKGKLIKKLFAFGIPLVPATVMGWFLNSMDRIALRYWSDFQQIGLYSAAFKIVMVLGIVQQAFSTFWVPTSYRWHEEHVDNGRFVKVSKLLMGSMSLVFVLILLFKGTIIRLLSPAFRSSAILVPFLSFYPLMYTVSETTTLGIAFSRKTSYNVVISAISVAINFIGNYLLVPRYGALGASIATGVSYVAFFWCRTLISRKLWFNFSLKYYFVNIVFLMTLATVDVVFRSLYVNVLLALIIVLYNRHVIVFALRLLRAKRFQFLRNLGHGHESNYGVVWHKLPLRKQMRKKHVDTWLVGLTVVIAVVIIIALYLRTNGGFKPSSNPPVTAAQAESSQSMAAPAQPSQDQAAQNATPQPLNSKIVAVGDSFTYGNPVGPGYSWPKWIANHLGVVVVNQGRVGQTSQDVLAHFDQDVIAAKPGRVIIFVGDGDAIKGVSEANYQNSIEAMVRKARANHIIPILALPLPYRGFEQRIKTMQDWLSSYAREEKIQTLDFATVLFDGEGGYLKGMSNDGKYPSLQGYEAMGKYAVGVLGQR